MRLGIVATIAVAVGLAISACGSDADPLTKPEFIDQANAICQVSQDEASPIFDAFFSDVDVDDADFDDPAVRDLIFVRFSEAMAEVKPIFDRQLDDIRALEPPAQDKQFIEKLIADQDDALDEFVRLLEEAAAGNEEARAIVDSDDTDPFADVDRRAVEYGLNVCGTEEG